MSAHLALLRVAAELDSDLQAAARRCGGPGPLLRAEGATLSGAFRGDHERVARFVRARRAATSAALAAELAAANAWSLALDGADYPASLCELVDPPFAVLGVGDRGIVTSAVNRPRIAIVGSRRPTYWGREFARALARQLARSRAVVLSGLALGIDAAAHQGAVEAGGTTIGVLGCGVDVIHPKANANLHRRIVESGGALLSEYWLGTRPAPWRFPARNRIIAGLADAVVVVEAAERSGALITADFALELGRPVLAVPGRAASPQSAGCHALIRAGAALCESAADVASELGSGWQVTGAAAAQLDGVEAAVFAACRVEPMSVDELVERLAAPAAAVAAALGTLELANLVAQLEGDRYVAVPLAGAA